MREGLVDLEIGVLGETGPEVRVQTLFRDRYVGVVRRGHALLTGELTPARYAACGHVVASRRGRATGPVDDALAALGLARSVVAVVPSFRAALAIAGASDLVALVTVTFVEAIEHAHQGPGIEPFALPVPTEAITVSQIWHPRADADPAQRWLRALVSKVCRDQARPRDPA